MTVDVVAQLVRTIHDRRASEGEKSYTRQLLDGGAARCAKKFGEEAFELAIAAAAGEAADVQAEAADVIYHLLVVLESRDIAWADVLAVLAARTKMSGLDEKANRRPAGPA